LAGIIIAFLCPFSSTINSIPFIKRIFFIDYKVKINLKILKRSFKMKKCRLKA
jgi:hypothetical protein